MVKVTGKKWLIDRFLEKFTRGQTNECWEWQASLNTYVVFLRENTKGINLARIFRLPQRWRKMLFL